METNPSPPEASTGMSQLDSILHPDVLLPSQYFNARQKHSPEHRLMIAVLKDALHCLDRYGDSSDAEGRRLFLEARQWLLSEDTDGPHSFHCICEALDLEPDAVRDSLRGKLDGRAKLRSLPRGNRQTPIPSTPVS